MHLGNYLACCHISSKDQNIKKVLPGNTFCLLQPLNSAQQWRMVLWHLAGFCFLVQVSLNHPNSSLCLERDCLPASPTQIKSAPSV